MEENQELTEPQRLALIYAKSGTAALWRKNTLLSKNEMKKKLMKSPSTTTSQDGIKDQSPLMWAREKPLLFKPLRLWGFPLGLHTYLILMTSEDVNPLWENQRPRIKVWPERI